MAAAANDFKAIAAQNGCWGAAEQLWNAFHNCSAATQTPLPLLPALAEHHCVGSSVPWRAGKTGDSAVERLFSGKTWVGLAGVDRWSAQGSAADTWAQNARLRSCRALRACRNNSLGGT